MITTGCFGGEKTPEPTASTVTQAPDAPPNLTAAVDKKTVTLRWDPVETASGYIVSLYDSASKKYNDLQTVTGTTFMYDGSDSKTGELKFGVCAFVNSGSYKLYSQTISKVTAVILQETIQLNREKLSVQVGKTAQIQATVASPEDNVSLRWTSADETVAAVDETGTVTAVSVGKTTVTATTSNGTAQSCTVTVAEEVAVPDGKLLAITFDDGPNPNTTAKLLDALKERDAKVTFFMLGQNAANNPDVVRRMKEEGHELGSHSFGHPDLSTMTKSEISQEMNKASQAIYDASGAYPTVFRAPYGNVNDKVLSVMDIPSIYWSVDTEDWKIRDAKSVKNQILNSAYDGAIILLHDIYETSVDGFIAALDQLEKEGYTLVTVTQLLNRNGTPPQAGVTYYDMKPA